MAEQVDEAVKAVAVVAVVVVMVAVVAVEMVVAVEVVMVAVVVVKMVVVDLGMVKEEGVMGVAEVMAVAVEVDVAAAVLGTVVVVEGVVRVEEVVAETVEVNKVAELLVAAEGMVREVGGVASRSSTQSNCIPSSLNTRMTGSPRTNRMLSAGMENGKHSRAVATEAVDSADSTAWVAMAEEDGRGSASRVSC